MKSFGASASPTPPAPFTLVRVLNGLLERPSPLVAAALFTYQTLGLLTVMVTVAGELVRPPESTRV